MWRSPLRLVRTPHYKYVRHFKENQMDELYNLGADPGEEQNLLRGGREVPQGVLEDLRTRLEAWQRSIDDPLLKSTY